MNDQQQHKHRQFVYVNENVKKNCKLEFKIFKLNMYQLHVFQCTEMYFKL